MTTYKWWLHVSFLKHSTCSTSANVPSINLSPNHNNILQAWDLQSATSSFKQTSSVLWHSKTLGFSTFNILISVCNHFKHSLWFQIRLLHPQKMQTSSKLVISYPWCTFSKFAPFFPLCHLLALCFLLPLVFFYCISCFQ